MSPRPAAISPRERVRLALRGELADRVPFTVYWLMLPRGEAERSLRNAGTTIVERVPLFHLSHPGFEVVEREYDQDGVAYRRRELRAPRGCLHATFRRESGYGTSWWQLDYFVKQPSDYDLLERYLEARTYLPDYGAFATAVRNYGEDGYVVWTCSIGQILWINFPSSVHLEGESSVREELRRILGEAAPGDRFLVGITEDVPEQVLQGSLRAISTGLRRWGELPLAVGPKA